MLSLRYPVKSGVLCIYRHSHYIPFNPGHRLLTSLPSLCPVKFSKIRTTLKAKHYELCKQPFHFSSINVAKQSLPKIVVKNSELEEKNYEKNTKSEKRKQHRKRIIDGNKDVQENPSQEPVTVFHKPSRNVVNINVDTHKDNDFSLYFRQKNKLVNIDVDGKNILKQVKVNLEKEESMPKVESINDITWKKLEIDYSTLHTNYLKLAKIRLTGLVVITTMAGYAMAPGVFNPVTFGLCTLGTGLTSASANAVNQFLEVPFDSQMNRTKNRPVVRGQISPFHAMGFAAVTGCTGLTILYCGVNPLTAYLGLTNLALYTMAYTPMKRITIANTWVGSIVGAIPPMMGWAACSGALEPGAWLLGGILFAWQFPHFNALSWNLRPDYSRAGYRMMSVINPRLCKVTCLRYSLVLTGLCVLAPVVDVTTWAFAIDSFALNIYMVYLSYRFYKKGDSNSSRKLFRFSLIHIPLLMILMLISKKSYGDKDTNAINSLEKTFKVSSLFNAQKESTLTTQPTEP